MNTAGMWFRVLSDKSRYTVASGEGHNNPKIPSPRHSKSIPSYIWQIHEEDTAHLLLP